MQRRLYDSLRNTSVYRRLWISSIAVAIVPMVLICVLLLLIFSNNISTRIERYSANLTMQVSDYISLQVQQLNSDIANFCSTENTCAFLRGYPYMQRSERYLALQDVSADISAQFSKLHSIADIVLLTNDLRNSIRVYGHADGNLTQENPTIEALLRELGRSGVSTVYGALYAPDFLESGGMIITKRVIDDKSGIILGYILVHMRESFLSSIYQNWDFYESGNIYILDGDGRIMSSNEGDTIGVRYPGAESMEGHQGAIRRASFPGRREQYICTYARIQSPALTVMCLVPRNYLANDVLAFALMVVLVAAVLIALSSGAASLVMNSITRPIAELTHRMHRVQNNELAAGALDEHRDELAAMINTFDQTVLRLKQSNDEIRRREEERVRLELRALTAQISPHFLTNTLNTVKNLARLQNAHNIESMMDSLMNILAARLGREDALVTLSAEAALLKDYINLQTYRYFNMIDFEIIMDDEVRDCLIPIFTLQPLVENALRHGGLDARMDGEILVKAYRIGGDVHISVTDNGAGMSAARLREVRQLREQPVSESSDHIGIQNVHQRIHLLFGRSYGLNISSEEGVFTEIDILLPYTVKAAD